MDIHGTNSWIHRSVRTKCQRCKWKKRLSLRRSVLIMSSRFHCGWCLNLISVPSIGLGHYDPLSSHEIDGVRKEKERLTVVTVFSSISWSFGDSWSVRMISGLLPHGLSSFHLSLLFLFWCPLLLSFKKLSLYF